MGCSCRAPVDVAVGGGQQLWEGIREKKLLSIIYGGCLFLPCLALLLVGFLFLLGESIPQSMEEARQAGATAACDLLIENKASIIEGIDYPLEGGLKDILHPVLRFMLYFLVSGALVYTLVHWVNRVWVTLPAAALPVLASLPLTGLWWDYVPCRLFHFALPPVAAVLGGFFAFCTACVGLTFGFAAVLVWDRSDWPLVFFWRRTIPRAETIVGYQCPVCGRTQGTYFAVCPGCSTQFSGSRRRPVDPEAESRHKQEQAERERRFREAHPTRRRYLPLHFLSLSIVMTLFVHVPVMMCRFAGVAVSVVGTSLTLVVVVVGLAIIKRRCKYSRRVWLDDD